MLWSFVVNVIYLYLRAEKEKAQYFGELNDLRASVDHLANEKVLPVWTLASATAEFNKSWYSQGADRPKTTLFSSNFLPALT